MFKIHRLNDGSRSKSVHTTNITIGKLPRNDVENISVLLFKSRRDSIPPSTFSFSIRGHSCSTPSGARRSLKSRRSSGIRSPSQVARCVWFRSSSSRVVFGCTSTLSGPRLMTSQGMNAPNWAGVKRLTSNMGTGCGPIGRSKKV